MQYHLKCLQCNYELEETSYVNQCPKCGGVLEVVIHNIEHAKVDTAYDSIMRYHEFLPMTDHELLAKYESTMPSPMIDATKIASKFGLKRIFLKDETVHATGTMKDREGLLTVNRLIINKIPGIVVGSSGNAGIALAWYVSKLKGPRLWLYLPENSRKRMGKPIEEFTDPDYVTVVFVNGSTDEAEDAGKAFAKENGYPYGTGFYNYSRREGVKTLALEYLLEQKERADWYFQGVAGALAVYAWDKAHRELGETSCKLANIQPDVCRPIVDAWKDGADTLLEKYIPQEQVNHPAAPVLKSRKPYAAYPLIKEMIDRVGGYCEAVTTDEIIEALNAFMLEEHFVQKFKKTGRRAGIEAATALAGAIKMARNGVVRPDETVFVNVSGAGKPTDIPDEWWHYQG